jgi:uncharacterized protein YjdB
MFFTTIFYRRNNMKNSNRLSKLISLLVSLMTAVTLLTFAAPSANAASYQRYIPYLQAQGHVQNDGWHGVTTASGGIGVTIGTTGRSLRLESIRIGLCNVPGNIGGIELSAYVDGVGWKTSKSGYQRMAESGTTGLGLAVEAVKLKLYGPIANDYDILYSVHLANSGWMHRMVSNGAEAGRAGYPCRVEALYVKLVRK